MKVKNIKIHIKERKKVFNAFAAALAKTRKGAKITPHHAITFQNMKALRKVLTEKRMELLHAIKHYAPHSLYELAKRVNRDLKSVNTDIRVLDEVGLISLEATREERNTVTPKIEFDTIRVEIAV